MLQKLYHHSLTLAASPHAGWWLFATAFAEASFFPIPVDLLLIPMVLASRERAFVLAAICTIGSVSGGLLGWVIGAALLQHVAMPIVHFYHAEHSLTVMQEKFRQYGVAIILLKGLTPIPFKIVTIAAGASHFAIMPFLFASLVTRGARFFLVATLLWLYGAPIRNFVERRLTVFLAGFLFFVIAGIVAVTFL